jgi:hypothetical protein
MPKERVSGEALVGKLRHADKLLGKGNKVVEVFTGHDGE